MVEDLDDLLAVDGFLDEGVHVADPHLLLDEVAAGAGDDWRATTTNRIAANTSTKIGERHRQPQHGDQCGQCGDRGREHLREGLADGLAQGVGVVGVAAHDVAVLVGVEVADRQRLLVCEHVVADLLEGALLDGDDEPLPQPAAESAGRVEAAPSASGRAAAEPSRGSSHRPAAGCSCRSATAGTARSRLGAAAPTRMHSTIATTCHLYWKM